MPYRAGIVSEWTKLCVAHLDDVQEPRVHRAVGEQVIADSRGASCRRRLQHTTQASALRVPSDKETSLCAPSFLLRGPDNASAMSNPACMRSVL